MQFWTFTYLAIILIKILNTLPKFAKNLHISRNWYIFRRIPGYVVAPEPDHKVPNHYINTSLLKLLQYALPFNRTSITSQTLRRMLCHVQHAKGLNWIHAANIVWEGYFISSLCIQPYPHNVTIGWLTTENFTSLCKRSASKMVADENNIHPGITNFYVGVLNKAGISGLGQYFCWQSLGQRQGVFNVMCTRCLLMGF